MPAPTITSKVLQDDGRYLVTLSDASTFYSSSGETLVIDGLTNLLAAVEAGGGSGGPATIADGADVALGRTTDAAITNPATDGTGIGFLRGILTFLARIPVLGQAVKTLSVPVVLASDQTVPVSGTVSVGNFPATQPVSGSFWQATQPVSQTVANAPSADVASAPIALNADNVVASVALAGHSTAGVSIAAGTLAATLTPVVSFDGGATWVATKFLTPGTGVLLATIVLTNANPLTQYGIRTEGGATHVGVRRESGGSGTAAVTVTATFASPRTVTLQGSGTAGSPDATVVTTQGVLGGVALPVAERLIVAAAAAMTRQANATPYSANDAVSNNATPGSVTAISFSVSNVINAPIELERLRILSTDTGPGTTPASFRAWLFSSDPAANTGVGGGDNLAWSQKQAGYIGSMVGTFRAFSDGSAAVLVPDDGSRIITTPVSGALTLFVLLQTLTAFTPSGNSTTFTCTLEGLQGVA